MTYRNKGMIKRADGSYSQRGLWDNIRAKAKQNKRTGSKPKRPTAEMLRQERRIRAAEEKAMGGYMDMMRMGGGINNPGFRALPKYVQDKIRSNMQMGGMLDYMYGGKMKYQDGGDIRNKLLNPDFRRDAENYRQSQLLPKPPTVDEEIEQRNDYIKKMIREGRLESIPEYHQLRDLISSKTNYDQEDVDKYVREGAPFLLPFYSSNRLRQKHYPDPRDTRRGFSSKAIPVFTGTRPGQKGMLLDSLGNHLFSRDLYTPEGKKYMQRGGPIDKFGQTLSQNQLTPMRSNREPISSLNLSGLPYNQGVPMRTNAPKQGVPYRLPGQSAGYFDYTTPNPDAGSMFDRSASGGVSEYSDYNPLYKSISSAVPGMLPVSGLTNSPNMGPAYPIKERPSISEVTMPRGQDTSGRQITTREERPNTDVSIVDYLNSKGMGSSFSDRKKIAEELGIRNYEGTAEQNLALLKNLRGDMTSADMRRTMGEAMDYEDNYDPFAQGLSEEMDASKEAKKYNRAKQREGLRRVLGIDSRFDRNPIVAENRSIQQQTQAQPQTRSGSTYTGNSIVDQLRSMNMPSDMASRKQLASQFGIENYKGTAAQNKQMLNELRRGMGSSSVGAGEARGFRRGGMLPKYKFGEFLNNTGEFIGKNPEVLGSVLNLGQAAFGRKPTKAMPMYVEPTALPTTSSAFNVGRNQLAAGMRAMPTQAGYAQYMQGINQLAGQEAQFEQGAMASNANARQQAMQQYEQQRLGAEQQYQEELAMDRAARFNLISKAVMDPFNARRQQEALRRQGDVDIYTAAAQISDPDERQSYIEGIQGIRRYGSYLPTKRRRTRR